MTIFKESLRREPNTFYDFNDIVTGTGVQQFYFSVRLSDLDEDGRGGDMPAAYLSGGLLLDFPTYSSDIVITGQEYDAAGGTQSFRTATDRNYDLLFNTTRMVNGYVIVNIPFGAKHAGWTGGQPSDGLYCRISPILYHVSSAGTETFLASGSDVVVAPVAASAEVYRFTSFRFLVTNQVFKKDEIFRVRILHSEAFPGSSATDGYTGYGVDPMNRNDDNSTAAAKVIPDAGDTQASVFIPFKLDVD